MTHALRRYDDDCSDELPPFMISYPELGEEEAPEPLADSARARWRNCFVLPDFARGRPLREGEARMIDDSASHGSIFEQAVALKWKPRAETHRTYKYAALWRGAYTARHGHRSNAWEAPLTAIAALQDGWSGEGTTAPSAYTLGELQRLVGIVQSIGRAVPQFSVDTGRGYVSMRWTKKDDPGFFSLGLRGDGKIRVSARSSDRAQALADTIGINEEAKLTEYLTLSAYDGLTST